MINDWLNGVDCYVTQQGKDKLCFCSKIESLYIRNYGCDLPCEFFYSKRNVKCRVCYISIYDSMCFSLR